MSRSSKNLDDIRFGEFCRIDRRAMLSKTDVWRDLNVRPRFSANYGHHEVSWDFERFRDLYA